VNTLEDPSTCTDATEGDENIFSIVLGDALEGIDHIGYIDERMYAAICGDVCDQAVENGLEAECTGFFFTMVDGENDGDERTPYCAITTADDVCSLTTSQGEVVYGMSAVKPQFCHLRNGWAHGACSQTTDPTAFSSHTSAEYVAGYAYSCESDCSQCDSFVCHSNNADRSECSTATDGFIVGDTLDWWDTSGAGACELTDDYSELGENLGCHQS
jgi:hypothetical protein